MRTGSGKAWIDLELGAVWDELRRIRAPDKRVVITADRGFARQELFQWLKKKELSFIIRVPRTVHISSKTYTGPLSRLEVQNGEGYFPGKCLYTKQEYELPNLVVACEQQPLKPDPRLLATNLTAPATRLQALCPVHDHREGLQGGEVSPELGGFPHPRALPEHEYAHHGGLSVLLSWWAASPCAGQNRPSSSSAAARAHRTTTASP